MAATGMMLIGFSVLLLHTTAAAQGSRYHSAKCIQLGVECSEYFEELSTLCKAGLSRSNQSAECLALACKWCAMPGNMEQTPCTDSYLRETCTTPTTTEPTTTQPETPETPSEPTMTTETAMPSPVAAPEGGEVMRKRPNECVWQGGDNVVVDLGRVVPAEGWTPVERDGMSGLVYRKDLNHGIVNPGAGGEMCFTVTLASASDYILTAVSYAPDFFENNDMWMRTSKPLLLWRDGQQRSFEEPAMKYLKAYQNNGRRGLSTEIFTKDSDRHHFIVPSVAAGEEVVICMDGRSYRYEVFRLVMSKCTGDVCMGGGLDSDFVLNLPVSPCQ